MRPEGFLDVKEEVKFDPEIHFDIKEPVTMTDLNFKKTDYPSKDPDFELAYTAPTQVLSKEGLRVLNSILQTHIHKAKQNPRSYSLRGLTYWSPFVRAFTSHPKFMKYVSGMANKPLCTHSFGMHLQVNFGKLENNGRDVDQWHFDSVDFVHVILLSNLEGMVGGELEVLEMDLGGRNATEMLKA